MAAEASGPDFFSLPRAESPLFLFRGGENTGSKVPTLLRDAGDTAAPYAKASSFPHAQYRSRGQEAKTAVHWGQRKLLVSEMQLLTYYCEPGVPHWIVYVGAAPGSHLMFLDRLYGSKHDWELVDPGLWDHRYATLPAQQKRRFNLRNEFFDNTQAYELAERRLVKAKCPALSVLFGAMVDDANALLVDAGTTKEAVVHTEGTNAEAARTEDIPIKYKAPLELKPHGLAALTAVASERCKMLFVSDVRSGSEKSCKPGDFDLHVFENMRAQEAWTAIVNPTFAMLKFRLPYAFISKYDLELKRRVTLPSKLPPQSLHPDGDMLLPVWTRPTSTECRLVVPANARQRTYDHKLFEDQMFAFNAVVREKVYFEHAVHGHEWVDHRYDGAAEVRLLTQFCNDRRRLRQQDVLEAADPVLVAEVAGLVEDISQAIGSSFERAFSNREKIHRTKADRAGWQDQTEARLREAREARADPFWRCPPADQAVSAATAAPAVAWGLLPMPRVQPAGAFVDDVAGGGEPAPEPSTKRHTTEDDG